MQITERNKAAIEDKNIEQLSQGLDAEGNRIEPPYTPRTVEMKKSLGQVFDRVTLHNEGPFWQGITAKVMRTGFEMIGQDPKTAKLKAKYGEVIGLTDGSKAAISNEIYRPEFLFELRTYLRLSHG